MAEPTVSSERTAAVTYAEKRQRTLEELRQDIRAEAKKLKSNASGRTQTLGLQTEQQAPGKVESTITLFKTIRLSFQRQRETAHRIQMERQRAKQVKKGPGSIFEGGNENGRVDMAAQMETKQEPLEQTQGE